MTWQRSEPGTRRREDHPEANNRTGAYCKTLDGRKQLNGAGKRGR